MAEKRRGGTENDDSTSGGRVPHGATRWMHRSGRAVARGDGGAAAGRARRDCAGHRFGNFAWALFLVKGKKFRDTVVLSFICGNYYLIID